MSEYELATAELAEVRQLRRAIRQAESDLRHRDRMVDTRASVPAAVLGAAAKGDAASFRNCLRSIIFHSG